MNPTERFPFVTIGLIVLNVIVFLYEMSLGPHIDGFIGSWGIVPYQLTQNIDLSRGGPVHYLTLVSSMFIHGGFLHIIGNMLYLWIFGNNVEDILGPARFLFFYLTCGLIAGLSHIVVDPGSTIPTVGASGAVAGVLGGYLLVYPRARVLTLIFIVIFVRLIVIPAGWLLILWFAMQTISGFASLGIKGGGVAWFAHIGGFLAGMGLMILMAGRHMAWRRRG